ncbi:MAG: valine--tRNA ligase, partial [Oscillospiraceae bacterium]|nr:valine--tRNA ligase [Oscillospiraceae bacterium]
ASEVEINADFDKAGAVQVITDAAKIYIPMAELIDMAKERERLIKELEQCEKQSAGLEARLQNPGFVNKAPENVVAAERDRLAKLNERICKLNESIAAMK